MGNHTAAAHSGSRRTCADYLDLTVAIRHDTHGLPSELPRLLRKLVSVLGQERCSKDSALFKRAPVRAAVPVEPPLAAFAILGLQGATPCRVRRFHTTTTR